jgi:hypothetical protein
MVHKIAQNDALKQVIPNCWQCEHFAISWDTHRPYSCRLMGFKSKALPSIEVFNADGQVCQCFYAKTNANQDANQSLASHAKHNATHTAAAVGSRSWLV